MAEQETGGRRRPHVMLTLSPDELLDLDEVAETRGLPRSRTVAALAREELRRQARRDAAVLAPPKPRR